MLFRKPFMVAEIAGAPAGASGPGAAPPAAPAAPAAAPGVRGPATPAGDDSPFPHLLRGGSPAAPAGGAGDDDDLEAAIRADPEARGIPHDRVRGMRGSWEKRARESERQALMRDLAPVLEELQQLRQMREQLDPAAVKTGIAKSLLEGLGIKEEPPAPKYVTEEQFQARLREERESFARESQHREDLKQAHLELQAAKAKYEKQFKHFPWLEEVAAAVWSTPAAIKHRLSFGRIVDGMVQQLESGIGEWNKAYVASKQEDALETPITPGSGLAPAAKPPGKPDHSPDAVAKLSAETRKRLLGVGG